MLVDNPKNNKKEEVYTKIECKFKNGKIDGLVKIYRQLEKNEVIYEY